jgi:MFS family permease
MERAEVRHNFLALGLDYSLFIIGMSFASQATILPAFAVHLGASNFLIGGIPAVLTLGWFLPSLFAAHHTERLARKLPFILRYTIWERLPMLALAALAFFLAERAPSLALGVFFAVILMMSGTGGTLMPAWMDIVGRTIPTTLRGRFFGSANLVASVGGLLGSVVTAWLLARFAPPGSYGLCFLGGFVFLVVSYVALCTVREPVGPRPPDPVSLGSYLRRMPRLLRRDVNLSWFLIARGLGTLGMMANGFYAVYALRAWQAAEWQVGVFTTLFLAGQVIGNLGMGWLADRAGHRLVLVLGVGALAVGNLVALQATSPESLRPVFVLSGIHVAAIHVSARTILLELAAAETERPTYLGLVNTALAPLNFAGPLVAGLLADRLGFSPVFALAAVFAAVGVGLLLARVREPRWAGQRAT